MATSTASGVHHVAYGCRDVDETVGYYEEQLGFPLVHTEVEEMGGGFFRHVFFDTGDGVCLAFFDLHGVGESDDWRTDLAESTQTPRWVNHIAIRVTQEQQDAIRSRMTSAGIKEAMEIDHDWCHSVYYTDPNGILVELCRDTPGMPQDADRAHALLSKVPTPR